MKLSRRQIKALLESIIKEIEIEDIAPVEAQGSSHIMKTFRLNDDEYYLKFSDAELFEDINPSLQILSEFLAYNVYMLYPGVRVPSKIELVFDKANKTVGLATSAIKGKSAHVIPPEQLAKKMSAGVFVDIFLANWDAVSFGNVLIDDAEAVTRIDPGGALAFRARGGRKGAAFSGQTRELETMLDPDMGAGYVYQHADMAQAAKTFMAVSWPEISEKIRSVGESVSKDLVQREMEDLASDFQSEISMVEGILSERHEVVLKQAQMVVKG